MLSRGIRSERKTNAYSVLLWQLSRYWDAKYRRSWWLADVRPRVKWSVDHDDGQIGWRRRWLRWRPVVRRSMSQCATATWTLTTRIRTTAGRRQDDARTSSGRRRDVVRTTVAHDDSDVSGRHGRLTQHVHRWTGNGLTSLQSASRYHQQHRRHCCRRYDLRQGYVIVVVCLFVLLATVSKNLQTDLHEIFGEGWQWASKQTNNFWWRSGLPSEYRDCFPDSSLLGDTESG